MFNAYSGTFFAALTVAIVPQLIRYGFTEGCASEIVNIGAPLVVAGVVMLWRWSKGDINIAGVRK